MHEGARKKWVVVACVLWISFLCAGVAATLFFATFDPVNLAQQATFPAEIDRMTGYSLGFLLFWLLLVINSLIILWLLRASKF
ncbi:MAG: hypothetical protein HKN50_07195 [Gammaproteobacteria bacterium]|nr:hypothetical protein [Gammaproteobacteria bacterium]